MRAIRYCWQRVNQYFTHHPAYRITECKPIKPIVGEDFDLGVVFIPEFMPTAQDHQSLSHIQTTSHNHYFKSTSLLLRQFRRLSIAILIIAALISLFANSANAAVDAGEFGSAIDYTMYKLAVERNDASAQYLVGRNFLKGKTVTKNIKEAIKWFKRASEQDHQLAQFSLGEIYFYGNGIKRNIPLGLEYMEKSAANGLDEAQLFLGNYFLGNNGGKTNVEKAKKWLLSASEFNNPRAQYLYGKLLLESGDDKENEKAVKWLRDAADAGLSEATKLLSRVAKEKGLSNIFSDKSNNKTVVAENTSTENNNSQDNSANSQPSQSGGKSSETQKPLMNSRSNDSRFVKASGNPDPIAKVKVDSSVAIRANNVPMNVGALFAQTKLTDSEKQLSPGKQFNLAMDYINGEHGTKKELRRGISLLLSAAHRDNPRAQYTYGLMLRDGAGVEKDVDAALQWLEKAAKAGLSNAKREYDNLKLQSMLVSSESNPDKPAAQFSLGLRLLKGEGIKKDEIAAAKWILNAAKQNHHEAEARIGSMYRQGVGVEKDERQAKRWLEKAANAGVLSAARELKALEDKTFSPESRKSQSVASSADDKSKSSLQKTSLPQTVFKEKAIAAEIAIGSGTKTSREKKDASLSNRAKGASSTTTNNAAANSPSSASPAKSKVANLDTQAEQTKALMIDKNSSLFPLMEKAKSGDSSAQYEVGVQLLQDKPSQQALDEAIKWLTLAANNHHLSAQIQLGKLYQAGSKVKRDLKKAYNWYSLAANSGDDGAQLILGDMYRNGEGVSADNSEAIRWYRKAANQGNSEARHRLGGCKIC